MSRWINELKTLPLPSKRVVDTEHGYWTPEACVFSGRIKRALKNIQRDFARAGFQPRDFPAFVSDRIEVDAVSDSTMLELNYRDRERKKGEKE